jgi:uncharacterized protein YbjT (DUF2867 family)
MSIVVMGGTGHLGRLVVEGLLDRKVAPELSWPRGGRRPSSLTSPPGVFTAAVAYVPAPTAPLRRPSC